MTVLKAEDMHCDMCVARITKAMEAENMKFKVSLPDKTVAIEGNEDDVKKARDIMDDLGFDTEIQK